MGFKERSQAVSRRKEEQRDSQVSRKQTGGTIYCLPSNTRLTDEAGEVTDPSWRQEPDKAVFWGVCSCCSFVSLFLYKGLDCFNSLLRVQSRFISNPHISTLSSFYQPKLRAYCIVLKFSCTQRTTHPSSRQIGIEIKHNKRTI